MMIRLNHSGRKVLRYAYLHAAVDGWFFEAVHKALAWEHVVEVSENVDVLLYQREWYF